MIKIYKYIFYSININKSNLNCITERCNFNLLNPLQQLLLWDFMDERDSFWLHNLDDFREFLNMVSDSDDSDWSEYDLVFD
jgi:hypothetical protein